MSGRQKSSSTAYGEQYEKARGAAWCLCQTAPQSIPPYRLPRRHTLTLSGVHIACPHMPACITRGSKHFILTKVVEMRGKETWAEGKNGMEEEREAAVENGQRRQKGWEKRTETRDEGNWKDGRKGLEWMPKQLSGNKPAR